MSAAAANAKLKRLGILGGTFDPPHLGHLILAGEALEQLKLERVLWVLTPDPPHKLGQTITQVDHRLAMVQATIRGTPEFELSRVDIDRPPPHYALDTVRLLGGEYPRAELVFLIGGDSLHDLPTWHKPTELVAACHAIGVMRRPADRVDLQALEREIPGIGRKLVFIDAPLIQISSSELRRRAHSGFAVRFYLPGGVYQIIHAKNLYR